MIRFIFVISLIDLVLGGAGLYGETFDVVLGVLLPYTGSWPIGPKIASAAAIAVDDIQKDKSLLQNRSIGFIWNDTHCDAGDGLYEVVDFWSHESVLHLHGFIGGGCDSVCEPTGLLSAAWNLPMISWGCTSTSLSNKLEYPTFVRTVGPYYKAAPMIVEIFHRFDWSRAAILCSSEHVWQLTSSEVRNHLEDAGVFISQYVSFDPGTESSVIGEDDPHFISLKKTIDEARIILIFAYGGDVRDIMLYAFDLGMIDGDYIFFTVDLFDYAYVGNNTWMGDDGRDDDALLAFGSIFNIHILEPSTQEYKNFTTEVRRRMGTAPFYDPLDAKFKVDVHAAMLYDAMYLYAVALHEVLEAGEDEYSGKMIVSKLLNRTFYGISGRFFIDEHGDRILDFALQDIEGMDAHDIAEYYSETKRFIFKEGVVVTWPDGSTTPPKDHPDCGWDNEFCQSATSVVTIIGVSVTVVVILITIAFTLVGYVWR
ncbi:atrial natriuretic peptide receptor 3-like [Anneissia japonica]|uniref:atrial natriuretic peptide receptor 3-like n=1 Tax=Anneissia japonica TaxID=1529436 RepID=UPI0014257F9B|nr:atrial natriuretic peptide receptor 3-like [Anneissia japonica]